jgi:hypothetical protein
VAALCWGAPLLDQAVHRPGNFVALVRAASSDEPSLGFSAGWRAVVHMIGVPPWWLQDARGPLQRIGDLTVRPGPFAIASALFVLAALAAVAAIGWRRRRADVCAAGLLGITLCVTLGLGASSTPTSAFATVSYTLRWTSPAGLCVWLLLGWAVAALIRQRDSRADRPLRFAGIPACAAVAVIATLVAVGENPPRREPYQPMRAISDRLEADLPSRGATRVEVTASGDTLGLANEFEVGVIFWLRRAGRGVVTSREVADRLSGDYARGGYRRVLHLAIGVPPPKGGRVILRVPVIDPLDQTTRRIVTVTVRPHG